MKLKRIIPLILFAFAFVQVQAQYPEPLEGSGNLSFDGSSMVCSPGQVPDAGTSTQSIDQSIFPTNQTNAVQFLCLGDSMQVLHMGGNKVGDPNTATPAGFSYIIYRDCPPSAMFSGPDTNNILMDPCHFDQTPPIRLTTIKPATTPLDIDGNATFFNNGVLQTFNGGAPISLWFAPITIDHFDIPNGDTKIEGECIDINTADAFNVIYLNPILITNVNNNAGGNGCNGQMTITGGLAEFRAGATGSDKLYNITITKVGDPTIVGIPTNGWQHGSTQTFRVPEAGEYDIVVEDGVSCGASTRVMMGSCLPTDFSFGDSLTTAGSNICMPLVVENFTDIWSFEFNISWDPTILTYSPPLIAGDLDDTFLQINITSPGNARILWFEPTFGSSPVTLTDGQIAFSICFDVNPAANPGDLSPISFSDTDFAVATINAFDGSHTSNDGSIRILSNNMTLDFSSCSSLSSSTDVGTFTVQVTGGVGPYQIDYVEVGNPGNSGSQTLMMTDGSIEIPTSMPPPGLPPGDYMITVTDANGDVQAGNVTIADAIPLAVRINPFSDPTCHDRMDGSLTAQFAGGIAPLAVEWSTGAMNVSMITNLGGGQYTVTVTDANGCERAAGEGLIPPLPITIDTTIQHVTCAGGPSDGAITVTPSGGPSTTYIYLWDNGDMTNSIAGLVAGTYCVDITSGTCTSNFCIDVENPMPPVITGVDSTSITCPGANDGALTVQFTPGFGTITPADIVWSNGMTGATISNLGPGTYTVVITASDGCTATETYSLIEGGFSISLNATPPTCSYDDNGLVSVTITPAPGPGDSYAYMWSTGGTGSFISDLSCGQTYSVTVTETGSGCTGQEAMVNLDCVPDIQIVFDPLSLVDVTCNGLTQPSCNGSVLVIASSGTTNSGDYRFRWDGSLDMQNTGSQHTATQLCQGWNTVTVSDLACFAVDSIFIGAPDPLLLDLDSNRIEQPSCFGDDDGSIYVAAEGGSSPYTYAWDNGSAGQQISNLVAGSYQVTITDNESCTYQISVPLDQPDLLVGSVNPDNTQDAQCNDSADGQIEVVWTGGNQGVTTFDWTPDVSSTFFAADLAPGLYTVTITDPKGCTAEVSHVISNPPPIFFQIDPPVEPTCFGETTVVTIDTAFGGAGGPYKFSVGGARRDTNQAIRVLAGPLTVTVYDDAGCTADTNIVINQPAEIIVDLGPEEVELDLGDSYVIDANILPPNILITDLIWSPTTNLVCEDFINGDTTLCDEVEVMPLTTTTYSLTVVDTNGCEGVNSILIDVDKNRNVYIPNAFSPNGDGFNDEFRVLGGPGVEEVESMQIFDRWGALLYEERNFQPLDGGDIFWDGRFKGANLNSGVYVYLIRVSFIDNVSLLYRGDITLLR